MAKFLTSKDNVIILTGSNDSNPFELMSEVSIALFFLKECNVFIVNVLHNDSLNDSLNERKLNKQLKLLTRNYNNCTFIETHGGQDITKQIIYNINCFQYTHKFLSYNNHKVKKVRHNHQETFSNFVNAYSTNNVSPKKGTIPYYFQSFKQNTSNEFHTGNSPNVNSNVIHDKQPVKGTIPYYFPTIKKPLQVDITTNARAKKNFFRS